MKELGRSPENLLRRSNPSIKNEADRILTDPTEVQERWKVYFDSLYNDPNECDEGILQELPQVANHESIPGIGEDEVKAAISRMKRRKAPGVDNISMEEIEAATKGTGLKAIHRLCKMVWDEEELPSQWKQS